MDQNPRPTMQPIEPRRPVVLQPRADFAAEQATIRQAAQAQAVANRPAQQAVNQPMPQNPTQRLMSDIQSPYPTPNTAPVSNVTQMLDRQEKEKSSLVFGFSVMIFGLLSALIPVIAAYISVKTKKNISEDTEWVYLGASVVGVITIALEIVNEKLGRKLNVVSVVGIAGATIAIVGAITYFINEQTISTLFGVI